MYKAFDKNLKCREYQFEIGKTYEIEDDPILCEKGFHFCRDMQNCFKYYDTDSRICEVKAEDIIDGDDKSVCRKITIIRELSQKEIMDKITNSVYAYRWARDIGNRDLMIDRITDYNNAYRWALNIGNKDVMIDKITDSEHAYWWAKNIGNKDVMIDKITDSECAYWWARDIGNQDVMIDRITDSEHAYMWARYIGNKDAMIDLVTESEYVYRWALYIGNHDVMLPRIINKYQRKHIEKIIRKKAFNKGKE